MAIITVPREDLKGTIQSLEETNFFGCPGSRPLRLVSGCRDAAHLDPYKNNPERFSIDPATKRELDAVHFDLLNANQKCSFGHYRAMNSLLSVESTWEVALICENDIRFSEGWQHFLERIILRIQREHGDGWILTLYRSSYFPVGYNQSVFFEVTNGNRYFEVDKQYPFWGIQAVVYPKGIMRLMPGYLMERCIRGPIHADVAIGEFAKEQGFAILASAPSLVQHEGRISTVRDKAEEFHQAECFFDSVLPLL